MFNIDPYESTSGKYIPIQKIKDTMVEYSILSNLDLSYEVSNLPHKITPIFITGRKDSPEESTIPLLSQPTIAKGNNNDTLILANVSLFVNGNRDFLSLADIATDTANLELYIVKVVMIGSTIDNNAFMESIAPFICKGFTTWISSNLTMTYSLTPLEKIKLEIVLLHYYSSLIFNRGLEDDEVSDLTQYFVINNLNGGNHMREVISETLRKIENKNPKNVTQLCSNILSGLDNSTRIRMFNKDVLFNLISNNMYGHGASLGLMMCIENPAMWSATMYASVDNRTFRRSRIATILEKSKRYIEVPEFINKMNVFLSNKILK